MKKVLPMLSVILMIMLLSSCSFFGFQKPGTELTLENYEKYLNVEVNRKLTGGLNLGEVVYGRTLAGQTVYTGIEYDVTVSGKTSNYDYEDVVVTVKIANSYISAPANKNYFSFIENALKDTEKANEYFTPIDLTLIIETDIVGNGSKSDSINVQDGNCITDYLITGGFEVADIAGRIVPVK